MRKRAVATNTLLLVTAALLVVAIAAEFRARIIPDTGVLLYVGAQVLDGARLYVDVIDINPPLIIWMNAAVVWAARTVTIDPIVTYRIAVVLAAVLSLVLGARILGAGRGQTDAVLLAATCFALIVLPRQDFGEREHLALIGTMPYLLLAVRRLDGASLPGWMGGAAGLLAGIGIAIKPHFILLMGAREGLLWARGGRRRPSPETAVAMATGSLYLLAAALLHPEFFTLLGWLAAPYATFMRNSIPVTALLGDGAAFTLGALIIGAALWKPLGRPADVAVLASAGAAFYLAAVLQQKGWRYHFYPGIALGWMVLVVVAVRALEIRLGGAGKWLAASAALGAVALATVGAGGAIAQFANPRDPRYDADPDIARLIPFVREHAGEGTLFVLSSNPGSAFPLVNYTGVRWGTRFPHLWPLIAAYDSALRDPRPLTLAATGAEPQLARRVRDMTVEDMLRTPPALILVLRPAPDEPGWYARRFDYLEFFQLDPRFMELMNGYERLGAIGKYDAYLPRRVSSDAPSSGPIAGVE